MEPELKEQKLAALEALLFIHGEPLTTAKIAAIIEVDGAAAAELVAEFGRRLEAAGRGLTLITQDDRVQLATKPAFHSILERFVKDELSEDLTPASLETLTIVSYFGPLSRSRIEYQRGVNSSFILRSLLLRGLIERFPDPDRPNSYLYRPTFELLRHLGADKQESLPEYEKFRELFARVEQEASGAVAAGEATGERGGTRDGSSKIKNE
jgi:segregation and condensation protein B